MSRSFSDGEALDNLTSIKCKIAPTTTRVAEEAPNYGEEVNSHTTKTSPTPKDREESPVLKRPNSTETSPTPNDRDETLVLKRPNSAKKTAPPHSILKSSHGNLTGSEKHAESAVKSRSSKPGSFLGAIKKSFVPTSPHAPGVSQDSISEPKTTSRKGSKSRPISEVIQISPSWDRKTSMDSQNDPQKRDSANQRRVNGLESAKQEESGESSDSEEEEVGRSKRTSKVIKFSSEAADTLQNIKSIRIGGDAESPHVAIEIKPEVPLVHAKSSETLDSEKSGKSGSSSNQGSFNETALGKMVHNFQVLQTKVFDSEIYRIYCKTVDNSRNNILAVAFVQCCLFGSIYYVLMCVISTTLPSIRYYNLIHVVTAFQGKLLLVVGWTLSELTKKGFAALEMQHEKKGIPLTKIAFVDPDGCRTIIRVFLSTLCLTEGALWILSFYMDWSPLATYIGNYSCQPIVFDKPFVFSTNDLNTWVDANSEFATLYEYGLPITNGIIGGSPATPLVAPVTNFQMEGPGIVYMIETDCVNATVSYAPPTNKSTSRIVSQEYWGSMFNVGLSLKFPAGSHGWTEFQEHDLIQECQVKVVSGYAIIVMVYVADVWGNIDAVGIDSIRIQDLLLTRTTSNQSDFGTISHSLGTTESLFQNITGYIAQGVGMTLNGSELRSDVSKSAYAQIFDWGFNYATGLYDPDKTWKSISAAVGIIGHYVLDQSDAAAGKLCAYKGTAGFGTVEAPAILLTVILILLTCGVTMLVVVTCAWMLVVGGGDHIDRCVQMIDDPLRTLYYMRGTDLVDTIRGNDIGRISLVQHLKKVYVRFGESKATRGNEMGTLTLNAPSKVVKIARNRTVA
ncbi:hypothetical protein HDU98_000440 [Podochytrium sp. JEL0797]|nr:hypothetical protein HDU98_000440 [Podochytrium sp. JEL0797]